MSRTRSQERLRSGTTKHSEVRLHEYDVRWDGKCTYEEYQTEVAFVLFSKTAIWEPHINVQTQWVVGLEVWTAAHLIMEERKRKNG
jgi:hypothetical protein